jgi:hypothetical protein
MNTRLNLHRPFEFTHRLHSFRLRRKSQKLIFEHFYIFLMFLMSLYINMKKFT